MIRQAATHSVQMASISALVISVFSAGCASFGSGYTVQNGVPLPDQKAKVTAPVSIGVLAFQAPVKPGERKLDAEAYFFPIRLVQSLQRHPAVSAAFLSPDRSPAAQVTISGTVLEADGENTEIEIRAVRFDGTPVLTRRFSNDLDSDDYSGKVSDPFDVYFVDIANAIGEAIAAIPPGSFDPTRDAMAGYAGRPIAEPVPDPAKKLAVEASATEQKLLIAASAGFGERTEKLRKAYKSWQREITSKNEDSREASAWAGAWATLAVLGAVADGLAGASTGYATTSPNTELAVQNAVSSASKASSIDSAAQDMDSYFDSEVRRPISVELGGEMMELREGSLGSQLAEFRARVKATLERLTGSAG